MDVRYLRRSPDVVCLRVLAALSKPGHPHQMGERKDRLFRHLVEVGGIEPPSNTMFAFKFATMSHTPMHHR